LLDAWLLKTKIACEESSLEHLLAIEWLEHRGRERMTKGASPDHYEFINV